VMNISSLGGKIGNKAAFASVRAATIAGNA
jgi:hypothetical protein